MNVIRVLAAAAITISLAGFLSVAASAQQPPKAPPPPPTKSSHVGRDICATHPNLPQCS